MENFLKKYSNGKKIAGPWIENERFVVELDRKVSTVEDFLKNTLTDKKIQNLGLGKYVAERLLTQYKLLINQEIGEIYIQNNEFAKFLTEYLTMRFPWM